MARKAYDWRVEVLKGLNQRGLNIPVTPHNLQLLGAWWHAEGGGGLAKGKSTAYNWLNSTRQYPGSTNYNSVGVQNYINPQQGIEATVDTLTNGYYGGILDALAKQAPLKNFAQTVYQSKWGTKRGIGGAIAEPAEEYASIPPVQSELERNPLDPRTQMIMGLLARAAQRRGGESTTAKLLSLSESFQPRTTQAPAMPQQVPQGQQATLQPGMNWTGTHNTDNLWTTKTAHDFMAPAGTTVGAPEAGVITRYGSAQGGEALYLRGDSGRIYWLGHIDHRLPIGTRVRAGQILAQVSPALGSNSHLHIDYQQG